MAEANGWYVNTGGIEIGPISTDRLKRLAREGEITPNTYVRRSIDKTWYPASQVKNLLPAKQAAPFRVTESIPTADSQVSSPVSRPTVIVSSPVSQSSSANRVRNRGHARSVMSMTIGFVCLVIGYYTGREHLKYEMRTALAKLGEQIENAMEASVTTSSESNGFDVEQTDGYGDLPVMIPVTAAFSDTNEKFTVYIVATEVKKVTLRNPQGDMTESSENALMIKLRFVNNDERRLLTFRDGGFSPYLTLSDEVGNVVRRAAFGPGIRPIASLETPTDIPPNEFVEHSEVFRVPPQKTTEVRLKIDLKCIGKTGGIQFAIPTVGILGFEDDW